MDTVWMRRENAMLSWFVVHVISHTILESIPTNRTNGNVFVRSNNRTPTWKLCSQIHLSCRRLSVFLTQKPYKRGFPNRKSNQACQVMGQMQYWVHSKIIRCIRDPSSESLLKVHTQSPSLAWCFAYPIIRSQVFTVILASRLFWTQKPSVRC